MTDRTDDRPRSLRSNAFPYLVAGAMSLGVVGLAALHSRNDLERAERTLKAAHQQVHVVERAELVLKEIEDRIVVIRGELADYRRLDAGTMSSALSSVIDALPEGVDLEAIRLDVEGGEVCAEIAADVPEDGRVDLEDSLKRAFASVRIAPVEAGKRQGGSERVFSATFSVGQVATAAATAETGP